MRLITPISSKRIRLAFSLFVLISAANISFTQDISGGGSHSISLCTDGSVKAFGDNYYFQLGDTNNIIFSSDIPITVNGLSNITAISAGGLHNLALRNDGTVWAWGNNEYGQLGKGDTLNSYVPQKITGLSGIIAISAGSSFSLALMNNGTVWGWGDNWYGQVGNGTKQNKVLNPMQVPGLSGITSVSAGGNHSLALKNDLTVWAWGFNGNGQLGNGTHTDTILPVKVPGLANVKSIDGGGNHSLALLNNGLIWAWGSNSEGQLGNGSASNDSIPSMVQILSNVKEISAGGNHSLALKNDSTVWKWGYEMNPPRRLSGPSINGILMPLKINALSGITKINCGQNHDLAYKKDGTFWAWGENYSGQLGSGTYQFNIDIPLQVVCPCGSAVTPTVSAGADISICPNMNSIISATGNGIAPLTYQWTAPNYNYFISRSDTVSPVVNVSDMNGGSTVAFSVIVRDKNLCSSSSDTVIATMRYAPPYPYIFSNPTNTVCNGNAVTLTASGGAFPQNYKWLPGGSTSTAISVAPTLNSTYTLITTDTLGCTSAQTAIVNIVDPNIDVHNVYCGGGNNGYALANPTGGSYPYTYAWSSGSTDSGAYGLIPGNYTLTVTDVSGCAATKTFTIVDPGPLTLAPVTVTDVSCNGYCNGKLVFHASGGTAPYSYYVEPLGYYTSDTVTYLCPGTYSVHVTDAGGCNAFQDGTGVITEPASAISASLSGTTNVSCFNGNSGSISSAVTGGTPPYSYLWSPGGQTTSSATGLAVGVYGVQVTDNNGCQSGFNNVAVTQPSPITALVTPVNLICNGGNNGSASVVANGGTPPYTYSWSNGGTTAAVSNLTAANYSVTVIDTKGCSLTSTVSVTQPTAISITLSSQINVSCNGNSDGAINTTTSGGTGPKTYLWSTTPVQTAASATGLSAGTYSLTVTDQAGCTKAATYTVTQPAVLTSSVISTSTSCNNTCTGTALATPAGGTAPYTYLWSTVPAQAGQTATGLCIGNYSVGIADSKGCVTTNTLSVTGPLPIPITATATPTSCGTQSGTATASITGPGSVPPFYILWNTGDTTLSISGLSAGIYRANVTDGNGCFSFADALVSNSNGPVVTTNTVTAVSCNGLSDGAVNINVTGGSSPYSYFWSNGTTSQDISNVAFGPYEITVTDAGGCTATKSIFVNTPAPLSIVSSIIRSSCTVANGTAAVAVNGGNFPYSYSWSTGSSTSAATPVGAGIYSVTVTDTKGCNASALVAVQDSGGPVAFVDTIAAANCGGNGFVLITPLDSGSIASYYWSNGNSTQNLLNAAAGNYGLVITDTSGCKSAIVVPVIPVLPPVKPICLVTVDSTSTMNIIIWDKPASTFISGFSIYRESSQNGIYQKVAFSPYSNLSIYYDSISDPDSRWAKYRISMTDICGSEGPLSPEHKTIHLSVPSVTAQGARLIWDDYVGYAFSYYHIFRRDSQQGNWALIDSVAAGTHTYLDNTLPHLGDTVSYNVEIANYGGCSATIKDPQEMATNLNTSRSNVYRIRDTTASSVGELAGQSILINIFPNPGTGLFTIELKDHPSAAVGIFNMLGEEVKQFNIDSKRNRTEVDMRKQAKGMYYLRVSTAEGSTTKKIVIE